MKRIAFYGGSFDPPHDGHLKIGQALTAQFALDRFVFVPAFHAPHKKTKKPTSAFHRFAMLALATENDSRLEVSKMELELPEKPYTVETLARLQTEFADAEIFFVMGADSWADITTWREWEKVLTMVNIIVVTRPDYEIDFAHVTDEIRARIVDLRKSENESEIPNPESQIYITDAVLMDISATEIREQIRAGIAPNETFVPANVARYIDKYGLYR